MVPIVRSFVSVPAGVVRMPFLQFILYTAGGSLIWNSVLIGLGVAAGDFIEKNLHYLDYVVVGVVVLAVAWFVWRKASGKPRAPGRGRGPARGRARPGMTDRDGPRSWRSTSTRPSSTSHPSAPR